MTFTRVLAVLLFVAGIVLAAPGCLGDLAWNACDDLAEHYGSCHLKSEEGLRFTAGGDSGCDHAYADCMLAKSCAEIEAGSASAACDGLRD